MPSENIPMMKTVGVLSHLSAAAERLLLAMKNRSTITVVRILGDLGGFCQALLCNETRLSKSVSLRM